VSTILTLHDPRTARRYYETGLWRDDTLYSLAQRHASERPDAWALRDSRHRITWSRLLSWVEALAAEMHRAGLRGGERVSVWLPNRAESLVIFLACSRNGYVCNPSLHQNYTTGEVVQLMERVQSAALFAQPGYGSDAREADVFVAAGALQSMRARWRIDPPGTRSRSHGFRVGLNALFSVDEPMANSSMLVLPSSTAPARPNCSITWASYGLV